MSSKLGGVETALTAKKKWLPRRVIIFAEYEDQSGSMSRWRQPLGQFWPAVTARLIELGGEKVLAFIYVLRVIVSGGVVTSEIARLSEAKDPAYTPDGATPLGLGFKTTAEKMEAFVRDVVLPNEVSIRNLEFLVVSDLKPHGETPEETAAGVAAFLAMVKKFNGKVTVVAPAEGEVNMDLARLLDVNERGVRLLSDDPKSIVNITVDSLFAASKKLGGSNPAVKNG